MALYNAYNYEHYCNIIIILELLLTQTLTYFTAVFEWTQSFVVMYTNHDIPITT